MSTVNNPIQALENIDIQTGSLLEFLYTYHTLQQLTDLLNTEPSEEILDVWDVTVESYQSTVHTAIDLVIND